MTLPGGKTQMGRGRHRRREEKLFEENQELGRLEQSLTPLRDFAAIFFGKNKVKVESERIERTAFTIGDNISQVILSGW